MLSSSPSNGLSAWGAGIHDALASLEDAGEAMIARTLAWSEINSGSYEPPGLARMRARLADDIAALPGDVSIEPLSPSSRLRADGSEQTIEHGAALRLRVRPEAPIKVALTGHYDTVFPAAHPFQTPWREADRLRGPGVADMKGGLSLMLAALEAFETLPGDKRVGYEVLLSPDEEIGSLASGPLLAELGARADFAMIYEPAQADGAMVGARKGSGNFSVAFKGVGAHVGRAFATGRNAIAAAARAAAALDALNGKRDGVTINVAAIDGGGPVNIVPDNAVLRFNIRVPDEAGADWALAEIENVFAASAREDGVRLKRHGGFTRPPKPETPALSQLVDWTKSAAKQIGVDLTFGPTGGVCEGNNLAAAGCPNIDTFGPRGGGLHTDQEFALTDSFVERAKLSLLMLAGADRGVFDAKALRA